MKIALSSLFAAAVLAGSATSLVAQVPAGPALSPMRTTAAPEEARPMTQVDPQNAKPAKNATGEKLMVLEFGDLQCPDTARWHAQGLNQLKSQLPANAEYAFHHFPLDSHPAARPAAIAVECAGKQGAQLREALLTNLPRTEQDVLQTAASVGVDPQQLQQCMQQDKSQQAVAHDKALGERLGVSATPTLVIATRGKDGQLQPLKKIRPDKEPVASVLQSVQDASSRQ